MDGQSVKIDKKVLQVAREYCNANGLKISWFISEALKDKLKNKGMGV